VRRGHRARLMECAFELGSRRICESLTLIECAARHSPWCGLCLARTLRNVTSRLPSRPRNRRPPRLPEASTVRLVTRPALDRSGPRVALGGGPSAAPGQEHGVFREFLLRFTNVAVNGDRWLIRLAASVAPTLSLTVRCDGAPVGHPVARRDAVARRLGNCDREHPYGPWPDARATTWVSAAANAPHALRTSSSQAPCRRAAQTFLAANAAEGAPDSGCGHVATRIRDIARAMLDTQNSPHAAAGAECDTGALKAQKGRGASW
jgi:hypothetical protein